MNSEFAKRIPSLRSYTIILPKQVIVGVNSVEKIGEEAKKLGSKALLIMDPIIAKGNIASKVQELLKKNGLRYHIFDDIEPEPSVEALNKALSFSKDKDFDIVIGIGGGSTLDIAKATAVMAVNPGTIEDYFGSGKIERRLNLILSPTTAGTGSEVSAFCILTSKGEKKIIHSPLLLPDVAIVDPMLTITMPCKVTANTGFDALSHAIESMLSVDSNEFTDTLNLGAIRLIGKYFRIAYHQGWNIEARKRMAIAAMIAGLAFTNTGLVIGHGVAMRLGEKMHIPHGEACALALPYAMEYNLPVAAEKLAMIASAVGENVSG
ncbi:MAG: iron-containing alcohol dehydrogenase, partial [Candidatus Bathyarchaeia archaeon]